MTEKSGDIPELVEQLGSRHGAATRRAARERLRAIGPRATPALLDCLRARDPGMRWEASKILQSVKDPRAAPLLCDALRDRDLGVQWVAAMALVALGRDALVPVLRSLILHPKSIPMRHGSHHVMRELSKAGLLAPAARPMIAALEGEYGDLAIVPAAEKALRGIGADPPAGRPRGGRRAGAGRAPK